MPKDAFRHEVASRLKEARREHTLTQRQLADLGLSTQQNISRYEKGFIPDSWFLLARLHSERAIDLNWLLGASVLSAVARADGTNGGDPRAACDPRAAAVTSEPAESAAPALPQRAQLPEPGDAAAPGLTPRQGVASPAELGLLAEGEERGIQL